MNLVTAIARIGNLLFNVWLTYKTRRDIQRKDKRRDDVRKNPTKAFAAKFGKPSNGELRKPAKQLPRVSTDLPTASVDKHSKRPSDNG